MEVKVQGISKEFKTKSGVISVLEDISFTVHEQEFLCIIGPSGCGKTTLLRIIANLLEPTRGKITIGENNHQLNHDTALVFQEQGIFPWMNVIDNICFGLEMQRVAKKDRYEIALPFIDRLGLKAFMHYFPHQLSMGMKQRVGLARGLVSRAEILLMDEPFSALDAQMRLISQEKLLEVCLDFRKTVIYVTHDIEEALVLANRILLLSARPARIKEEVMVNLPKPRTYTGGYASELLKMKQTIWDRLREEVDKQIN